jgi:hypothetical protein
MDRRGVQMPRVRQCLTAVLGALIVLSQLVVPASANHPWGTYHWKRTGTEAVIKWGNSVTTPEWQDALNGTNGTIADWEPSTVIDLEPTDLRTDPRTCKPVLGTIQVCNYEYGNKGWLGLATISVSGGHITQATAKLNDTYFKRPEYDTPAWRRSVMCQEVAHGFGLGHQDEDDYNDNLGSCMDYTYDPDGTIADQLSNVGPGGPLANPNSGYPHHDFEQLGTLYAHVDSATTGTPTKSKAGMAEAAISDDPREWGQPIDDHGHGRPSHFVRDFGDGHKLFTFVIWVEEASAPTGDAGTGDGGHAHEGTGDDGHVHDGTNDGTGDSAGDGGRQDGGKRERATNDGGRQDGGRDDGGKRDSAKHDGGRRDGGRHDNDTQDSAKQDGGKRDGSKQRQGDHHDGHRHSKRSR